jgi:hypothetical protein
MTTMTMPRMVERTRTETTRGTSQLVPFLLAVVLVLATAAASIAVSGLPH